MHSISAGISASKELRDLCSFDTGCVKNITEVSLTGFITEGAQGASG